MVEHSLKWKIPIDGKRKQGRKEARKEGRKKEESQLAVNTYINNEFFF